MRFCHFPGESLGLVPAVHPPAPHPEPPVHTQRFRKSTLFTDKQLTSTYLGKEIKKIRAGDIFVIDIAMIPTVEEQTNESAK